MTSNDVRVASELALEPALNASAITSAIASQPLKPTNQDRRNTVSETAPTGLKPEDVSGKEYADDVLEDARNRQRIANDPNIRIGAPDDNDDKKNQGGDWTTRHNAARKIAAYWLRTRTYFVVYEEYKIAGASKKKNGNEGQADIVAYDPVTGKWHVWEVKRTGGVNGEAGAESKGPSDIDWYIDKMNAQHPERVIEAGMPLPRQLLQPDPLNPKQTLVTTSSVNEGRPIGRNPGFDGVVIYWTRKPRTGDDNIVEGDAKRAKEAAAAAEDPEDPGMTKRAWDWWVKQQEEPKIGPIPIPIFVRAPIPVP